MKKILVIINILIWSFVSYEAFAWQQRPNAAQAQCMVQAPYGFPATNPPTYPICREGYFVGYDAAAKLPKYVTYQLVPQNATDKVLIVQGASSQSANYLEIQNSAGTALLAVTPSGAISGAITPTIITSTGGLTLNDSYNGYIIEQTGVAATGTFTLGTVTIPGWNCMVVNIGSGVTIASGTNTMLSPGGLKNARTQYSSISIYSRGSNTFLLGGDLA